MYWNTEALGPLQPSADQLEVISRIFENSAAVLAPYTDAQLNQGFLFLTGAESLALRGLADDAIAWDVRNRCIRSFAVLFRDLFMARCAPLLSHLRRGAPEDCEASPLNTTCYMWWDFDCWTARPADSAHRKVDAAYLDVMRRTLALPHDACRESALHGRGHWHRAYPEETDRIIDEFLVRSPDIQEQLSRYAQAARTGCIQ